MDYTHQTQRNEKITGKYVLRGTRYWIFTEIMAAQKRKRRTVRHFIVVDFVVPSDLFFSTRDILIFGIFLQLSIT